MNFALDKEMTIWTKDEVNIRLSRLLDGVVSIAMEDHIISDDEETIIEKVRKGLWMMEEKVSNIVDLDDDKFKAELRQTMKSVIDEVMKEAQMDGIMTQEENRLIKKIRDYIVQQGLEDFI